jgi:hypothetical protein
VKTLRVLCPEAVMIRKEKKAMITRRDFLRLAGLAGTLLALPWQVKPRCKVGTAWALGATPKRVFSGSRPGISFIKYVDPLPLIEVMPHTGMANHYQIALQQFSQKIHRDLPPTPLWGCGAVGFFPSWPGRTSEARINVPVKVRWINHLPT